MTYEEIHSPLITGWGAKQTYWKIVSVTTDFVIFSVLALRIYHKLPKYLEYLLQVLWRVAEVVGLDVMDHPALDEEGLACL